MFCLKVNKKVMFDKRKVIFEINGFKSTVFERKSAKQIYSIEVKIRIVYNLDKIEAYGHKKLVRF